MFRASNARPRWFRPLHPDADPSVDVIIVARGGGSFEDLIGFSGLERVVRAAYAYTINLLHRA